jgi:hypothetical protein
MQHTTQGRIGVSHTLYSKGKSKTLLANYRSPNVYKFVSNKQRQSGRRKNI